MADFRQTDMSDLSDASGQPDASKRMLLHACCGPCSLEPVRVLREQGYDITIAYVNPNIQPQAEYDRRLETLRSWAATAEVPVIEGLRDTDGWERDVACWGTDRPARCAACYRLRLRAAAQMASEGGYPFFSTTLAVSPYQLFDACGRELKAAADTFGLQPVWQDFRPLYPQATMRSKQLGMYRQNYCGCRFSAAEASLERSQARDARRHQRDIDRAEKMCAEPAK